MSAPLQSAVSAEQAVFNSQLRLPDKRGMTFEVLLYRQLHPKGGVH